MLVMSMSHTLLTCQHENFSLLLLPQQETRKCPDADKAHHWTRCCSETTLGIQMDFQNKSHPNSTDRTEGAGLTSTDPHAAGASSSSVPELRIAPRFAPCCLHPTATTPALGTSGTEAAGWNSETPPARVGLAVQATATLTLPNTRIRGGTAAAWLGMLLLQLDLHSTNLSDPRGTPAAWSNPLSSQIPSCNHQNRVQYTLAIAWGRNGEGTIERTGPIQAQTLRNTFHLRPVPFQFQYFHRRGLSQILNCSIILFYHFTVFQAPAFPCIGFK